MRLLENSDNIGTDLVGPERKVDGADNVWEVRVGGSSLQHSKKVAACCCSRIHVSEPWPHPDAVEAEFRKRTSLFVIKPEDITKAAPLATRAFDADARQPGG